MTLTVAACLWDANEYSRDFSRCYDESWVEKLYRGFARNLRVPFQFVAFVDRLRTFSEPVSQCTLDSARPSYSSLIEPFKLNEPMIVCGLDTVVTGSVDHLARYCLRAERIVLPRPVPGGECCNGVVLVPGGHRSVWEEWGGENDMEWLRTRPHDTMEELFPKSVASYKLQDIRKRGLRDERIVYFHGRPKPHELSDPWIAEHWR